MTTIEKAITRFKKDEDGAIAIMFTLSLIVVLFIIGLGIDTGRAMQVATRTSAALDSAALAAAKAMREQDLGQSEVATVANDFFQANIKDSIAMDAVYGPLQVDIDQDAGRVSLTINSSVPPMFAQVGGFDGFDMVRSSTAIYNIRDIELGVMLDVTGSMGGKKIEDLREAAKALVDVLITNNDSSQSVRIGLAPYSASVNAGPYASAVTDPLNPSSDNCVIERKGASAYDDVTPGAGTWIEAADLSNLPSDTDPTEGLGSYRCPSVAIMPLTNDHDALKTRIDSFEAGGWTSGHIGLAWAWYLVSPDWDSIWPGDSTPVAYKDGKTIKSVVLMTDGNFNTAYANGQSSDQAEQLCDEMRDPNKEIIIFSIAFQAPAAARNLLQNCSSPPSSVVETTYFDAKNGQELQDAFRSIAIQLNNLRISS